MPDCENEESDISAPGANPGEAAAVAPPPPAVDDSVPKEVTEEGDDVRFYPPLPRLAVPNGDAGLHKYGCGRLPRVATALPKSHCDGETRLCPGTVLACDIKYSPLSRQILFSTTHVLPMPPLTRKKELSPHRGETEALPRGTPARERFPRPCSPEEALELVEIRSGDVSSDVMEDYVLCVAFRASPAQAV